MFYILIFVLMVPIYANASEDPIYGYSDVHNVQHFILHEHNALMDGVDQAILSLESKDIKKMRSSRSSLLILVEKVKNISDNYLKSIVIMEHRRDGNIFDIDVEGSMASHREMLKNGNNVIFILNRIISESEK